MGRRDTFVIAPGWQSLLHRCQLDDIAGLYDPGAGRCVKAGTSSELRRATLDEGGGSRTLFIKKYWYPTFRERWSGATRGTLFGMAKAEREYRNLVRLREWGLDAPTPVAFGLAYSFGWLQRSAIVSEAVPAARSLDLYIRDELASVTGPGRRAIRQALIGNLARCSARMHDRRFVHNDFYWRNILISHGSLQRFYLIDAHRGHRWWINGRRHRIKDLATLDAPAPAYFRRSERMRFLLDYLGLTRLRTADKRLVRAILQAAEPMRERQLRRVADAKAEPPPAIRTDQDS